MKKVLSTVAATVALLLCVAFIVHTETASASAPSAAGKVQGPQAAGAELASYPFTASVRAPDGTIVPMKGSAEGEPQVQGTMTCEQGSAALPAEAWPFYIVDADGTPIGSALNPLVVTTGAVDQGTAAAVTAPWPVQLSDGSAATGTPSNPLVVTASAKSSSATSQVLVLTTATPVPAAPLVGRKGLEIQNLGPNPIWCRCDGVDPVANLARQVDSDTTWPLDCDSAACVCKCIALVDQVSGNATIVTEIK